MKGTSLGGASYFISFTDDFNRFTWLYFMRYKSQALDYFKIFKAMVENRFDTKIGSIRSDRGGEYLSQDFEKCMQDAGISRELTTAFTPSQIEVSKRKNLTLFEKARAMVADARTLACLWAEATAIANYVTNRSPTRANSGITPYQRLKGNPRDLSHL